MSGHRATWRTGLPYGTLQDIGKMVGVVLVAGFFVVVLVVFGAVLATTGAR